MHCTSVSFILKITQLKKIILYKSSKISKEMNCPNEFDNSQLTNNSLVKESAIFIRIGYFVHHCSPVIQNFLFAVISDIAMIKNTTYLLIYFSVIQTPTTASSLLIVYTVSERLHCTQLYQKDLHFLFTSSTIYVYMGQENT